MSDENLTYRVEGKPELMDLPVGTEVLDFLGIVWIRGKMDGSCISLSRPDIFKEQTLRTILRFYQPVKYVGRWYLSA